MILILLLEALAGAAWLSCVGLQERKKMKEVCRATYCTWYPGEHDKDMDMDMDMDTQSTSTRGRVHQWCSTSYNTSEGIKSTAEHSRAEHSTAEESRATRTTLSLVVAFICRRCTNKKWREATNRETGTHKHKHKHKHKQKHEH